MAEKPFDQNNKRSKITRGVNLLIKITKGFWEGVEKMFV
jgi:hypothetical protein